MKSIAFLVLFVFFISFHGTSQSEINVAAEGVVVSDNGKEAPEPTAVFEASSTDKGVLFPRLTTAQRNQISNPAIGLFVFNTDINKFEFFDGTSWQVGAGNPYAGFVQYVGSGVADTDYLSLKGKDGGNELKVYGGGQVVTPSEVQANNTYRISTITKWWVLTNSTTNLCQSSAIGIGDGGMLKVTVEMKGDPSHDQNCESIWYVPYRRGNAWAGLKTTATKVSEICNIVSVNLNSTVSGNTIILSVTLGNYNPNHNVNTVTLKIEHLDRSLSWSAL